MNDTLEIALIDKSLTPLEFRTLYYIVCNTDTIYLEQLKRDLQIKTNSTMSSTIKKLINQGYLSRTKRTTQNKKGQGAYSYQVLSIKSKVPSNENKDAFFDDLYKIFDYFKQKLNLININEISSIKNIRLLIYVDKYPTSSIIETIDKISQDNKLKNSIRSITGLRKYMQRE